MKKKTMARKLRTAWGGGADDCPWDTTTGELKNCGKQYKREKEKRKSTKIAP